MKTVTRKQLMGMGASSYQAELVTKTIKPVQKQGRTNIYDLFIVSDRASELMENQRLRESTRKALKALRWEILALSETTHDAPFGLTGLDVIEYAEWLGRRAKTLFTQTQEQERQIRQNRKVVPIENFKNVSNYP